LADYVRQTEDSTIKPAYVLVVSTVLLVVGIAVALYEWGLSFTHIGAIVCVFLGLSGITVGSILRVVSDPKATATIVNDAGPVLSATGGVFLIVWGQAFLALAFISSWRLVFPSNKQLPVGVGAGGGGLPTIGDLVQLLQALTVAPTWLSMGVVGAALTGVGA